jgi:arylsulfate sulfotransferase
VKRCLVLPALFSAFVFLTLIGCGTSGAPNFNLSQTPYDFGVTLVGSTASKTVAVLVNNGNSTISLNPTITGSTDFSVASGGCGTTLAVGQNCNVVVSYAPPTGSSPVPETAVVNLGIKDFSARLPQQVSLEGTPGVPAISLSQSSYGFGNLLVGGSVTQTAAVVTNTGNVGLALSPALSGDASFSLGSGSCGAHLAVGATCNVVVQYAPMVASAPAQQTAVVNLGLPSLLPAEPVTVTGTSGAITGAISNTANTMVAQYTLTVPFAGTWNVSFGKDTGYGLTTNIVTTTGGATSVFVAGMLPNTTYHMRANVTLADGQTGVDVDHTFASGALPSGIPASFPVTLGTGTPQPGIEIMDPIQGAIPTSLIATDLQGNVIWTYKPVITVGAPYVYPMKLLPNGDFLMYIGPTSYPVGEPGIDVLREINLAGDTVRELTLATLNTEMVTAGFPITLDTFTHDFVPLANGHTLVMANTTEVPTTLTGYPAGTKVVGDVVIDLDANWNPDWVWNEFDHLDVNRHPYMFPDWTHSNSLDYSTDDGDFIVSMRHQNEVVKVDFNNGAGTGNVVWTLGEGGNFTLVGGVDPTDWFYAQHDVTYATKNTTGVYSITVMDNGDDREFPGGKLCGTTGEPACYTTIQELQLNDSTMTATFQFHQILPGSLYSFYGGSVDVLANGDIEYDLAGIAAGSKTIEVTPGSNPQTVWQLTTPGSEGYRTFRMPSLYPGVQW